MDLARGPERAVSDDSVVVRRHDDGHIEILEAPERARFALSLLASIDPDVVGFVGGLMVLADHVAYRPVAFVRHDTLVCEREPWKTAGEA